MAVTYFGNNVSPDAFSAIEAGTLYYTLFTNGAGTGNVTEMGINLHANYTGYLRLGIYAYSESASQPGALVGDAGALTNPVSGWNTISSISIPVVNDTQYWLCLEPSTNTPDYVNFNMLTSLNNSHYAPRTGGYGALPDPCPATIGGEGNQLVIRAGVETGGATNVIRMII